MEKTLGLYLIEHFIQEKWAQWELPRKNIQCKNYETFLVKYQFLKPVNDMFFSGDTSLLSLVRQKFHFSITMNSLLSLF